jgi:hypothetical protein
MGDLKPGWKRVKFGDVVRQVKDKVDPATSGIERFVAGDHMDTDDLRIRRWGDVGDGYLGPAFHMRFKPGQVLYGSRRTYLRKVAVADFEGICANTTFILDSVNPNKLLPELLPFIMSTEAFHEHSKRESKGSVNPYVNFSDLAWYEFALPPLGEQLLFADCLGSICKSLNCLEDAIQAKNLALVSSRRELFGAQKGLPASSGLSLGDICEFLDHIRVPLSGSVRQAMQGDYPYYGASGVIDRIDRYLFQEPLLLISEDGANLVSRTTPIAFVANGKYWVNNHAHVIRARAPWTNALLAAYIETIRIQQFVSGTAQPKLTRAACEEIPVPALSDACIFELLRIEAEFELTTKHLTQRTDELEHLRNVQLIKLCGMTT